jgi:hypothetical protein
VGFRDDIQAALAVGALLAPLPFRDLWSERGPSARAQLLLDRNLRSEVLTAPEQLRLFVASALWELRRSSTPLSWSEVLAAFDRWAQRTEPDPRRAVTEDTRTAGDARELVEAVHRGPAAVDGWLACYATRKASLDIPHDQVLVALARTQEEQQAGRYPSFADVARWTGLDVRRARQLLEQLEQLGWVTPPEVARGLHAKASPRPIEPRPPRRGAR